MKQILIDVCTLEHWVLCGLFIELSTTSESFYSPSALRWIQATQQVNAVVAGLPPYKRTSCDGLGNATIYEMT